MVYGLQEGARSTDQAGNRMSEQQMIENIERSVQLCQRKAKTMLNKYEDVVVCKHKRARRHLSSRARGGNQK